MGHTANELGLTTSGVSRSIQALEVDLGCRLFQRTSRSISLTRAGLDFAGSATRILEEMASARNKLRSCTDWNKGELRIAASISVCQYLLPPVLREFRESFPGLTIHIEPTTAQSALARISKQEIDLGVFVEPTLHDDALFVEIAVDELHFLLNPIHSWALKRKVIRSEIPTQKFVLPGRNSQTHALIASYFQAEGVRVSPFVEIDNAEAIKQFVQLDLGVGLLPKWIAKTELANGSLALLPLGRRRLKRRWGILHSRSKELSCSESLFIDLCKSVARELMSDGLA